MRVRERESERQRESETETERESVGGSAHTCTYTYILPPTHTHTADGTKTSHDTRGACLYQLCALTVRFIQQFSCYEMREAGASVSVRGCSLHLSARNQTSTDHTSLGSDPRSALRCSVCLCDRATPRLATGTAPRLAALAGSPALWTHRLVRR